MKNLVFILLLLAASFIVRGQYNIPPSLDHDYCHHIKSAENHLKTYHTPRVSSGFLDEYDVSFYFLDLTVENNTTYVAGNATIKARSVVTALDTIAFELIPDMNIETILVNGSGKDFSRDGDLVLVPLDTPIPLDQLFSVQVYYEGTPPSGSFFAGVSTSYDANYDKNVTWTLSEPYAAKEWFPVKMDLQDKADSAWVFLTTSSGNMAGSQGLLTGVTPMPGDKLRYEWKTYYPIAYYLLSFAVADYQEYNIYAYPAETEDSVFIQNFIYDHPNCLPNNQEGIDNTANFLELFSEIFGPYPFINEKYGHCMTELGGGMEHQTMTTIGSFGFGLVAHELGHMWYGDNVTCATWNDIWINEGFATYSDYLAHSFLTTPYYDSLWLKIRHDQVKSQPGGSVYVPDEELGNIWRIFDGRLSYSKGALLLHMIRFELQDDDMFFNVLKTYTEEFTDSVATGEDFREWLEYISGQDFTDFFDQWYYGEGYPIYDISWYQDEVGLHITSTQTTSTQVTTLFKMLVPFHVTFFDGTDTTLLLYQDANLNNFSIPVDNLVDEIHLDPDQWILHKLNSLVLLVEETENPAHFTIGPNPATDKIRVYLSNQPGSIFTLKISDLSGRLVHTETFSDLTLILDISSLSGGLYIVSLDDGEFSYKRKLIVE